MNRFFPFLFLVFFFSATSNSAQCLNGIYTIGGTTPDYPTFSTAVAALINNGVCGPVVFQARNGTYNEQFSIPAITGASAMNTITFEAENAASPNVTISFNTTVPPTPNYVVELNSSSYLTFRNLKFLRLGSYASARVIVLLNNCQHDQFLDNTIQTTNAANTSDTYAGIWADTTNNSNLLIDGNNFIGSSYAIRLIGPTLSFAQGNSIRNNTFTNPSAYYIYAQNQTGIEISGNISAQATNYPGLVGFSLTSCPGGLIDRNKIYLNVNCIFLYNCISNAAAPFRITNNFLRTNVGSMITTHSNSYVDIINNSLSVTSNVAGTGVYAELSTNIRLLNNCIALGLHAFDFYTASGITSDYNNLYLQSSTAIRWGANNYSTLTAWRAASGNDMNSIAVVPGYINTSTDLHIPTNINIEGRGIYVPNITVDIDNQTRSNPPDIGADEFLTPADNAQILGTQLSFPVCPGNNLVNARIRNIGTAPITSVMLGWKVNNVIQPPVQYTGTILSADTTAYITLGNYNFIAEQTYNVKIWCYSPNGNPDPTPQNDTIIFSNVLTKMAGIYTIKGLTPDYLTFNAAVAALNTRGVCGPVTFNVWDGVYPEKISLTSVAGASATNRITFQSANSDSTLVVLQFGASGSSTNDYVISFSGADYFTFREMTIRRTNITLAQYGKVIYFNNSATFNVLENNHIEGIVFAPSYLSSRAIIHSYNLNTARNDSNTIQNNRILFGSYGVVLSRSTSPSITPEIGWIIRNNQFIGQTDAGIEATNQSNILIENNTINTIRDTIVTNITFHGIYLNKSYNNVRVAHNIVNHRSGWGIYIASSPGTVADPGQVINNMVSNEGIGLYITGTTYYCFAHNSFNIRGPVSTSQVLYQSGSSNITLLNNILVQSNGGKIFNTTPATGLTSDYNDFFTTGVFSTSYPTLAQWQTTLNDLNSVFIQPNFISSTNLHIAFNDTLNNRGDSLGIITDLDHVTRYAPQPDMGADEFDSSGVYDVGVAHFVSPNGTDCHGMPYVKVSVKNYSTVAADTVKAFTLYLSINAAMIDTLNWTGTLLPGDSVNVLAASQYYFVYAQNYQLKAWTDLPNNSSDSQPQNDTAILVTTQISMGGTYTIGGLDPDFRLWNDAVDALVSLGVCDSVIFDIRNGLYNEQVIIPQIPGAAQQRSITFRSEALDSTSVVLFYTASSIADWMLYLDGADYLRFCYLSIGEYENTTEWRGVIDIRHGATHNEFHNNVLYGRHLSSPNPYNNDGGNWGTIRIIGGGNHDQRIERNRFENGYFVVFADSATSVNRTNNIIVRDNIMYNPQICIFSFAYLDSLIVDNNVLKTTIGNLTGYNSLIELDNCRGSIKITRNHLYGGNKGIGLENCTGTSAEPILVSNNFYAHTSSPLSRVYGIHIDSSYYVNIIHNSVSIPGQPSSSSNQLYGGIVLHEGSNINIWNNSLANYNGWVAIFTVRANIITACDYNNYYTYRGRIANNPSNYPYVQPGDTLHLNAWQALTGFDLNSTTVDPHFAYRNPNFSGPVLDLHLDPYNIVPLVSQLYFPNVSGDIDNDIRNTLTPTVGADEFTAGVNDANLAYMQPGPNICTGNNAISVLLRNIGTQPLTTLTIAWSVNNIPQTPFSWTGSLNFADSTMVTIGSYNFPIGSSAITIYSQLPNGSPDPTPLTDTLHYTLSASAPPLPNLGPDIQLCSSATISITPGSFSHYLWSDGSTTANIVVGPGTWSVNVSNIVGCSNSDTIVVSIGTPNVTVSGNLQVCAGSSTTLTANGANTYSWMPGNLTGTSITVNPAATTTYTVTGTISPGCSNTFTFTVVVNPLPPLTLSGNVSICPGGTATLTANGASTYSWMPGNLTGSTVMLNPVVTTTYTMTGTASSGCSNTLIFTVTVNPLPNITISGSASICSGSNATLTANGANTYSWMPGNLTGSTVIVSPASGTTYTVTGTSSSGCTDSSTAMVNVDPLPNVLYNETQSTVCINWNAIILAPGAPAGGTYSGPGVTGNSFDPVIAGTGTHAITYSYTDANGCSNSATSMVTVDLCTAIDQDEQGEIVIYPNPTTGWVSIDLSSLQNEPATIKIINLLGEELIVEQTAANLHYTDLSTMPNGVYFIVIEAANLKLIQKLVLEN